MDFDGATVLITGGTSGIGRATAQLFARDGATVIVTGRDRERGDQVAAETSGRFVSADLTIREDVRRLATDAGAVDVLINNAGYWELGPTADTTPDGFDAMVDINLRAPFFLTAALAPQMAARGRGAIVNVSTMVAARGAAGMAGYGATKAALEALTRSWAVEYGPAGVRVNAVALGPTRTVVTRSMGDMLDTLAAASPLQRANEPADVAEVIAYLAGDAARSITGVVLAVDAGRVAAL
jgi:NAD(P)-dependent dehydrogenase (short-subunit alcohol dehydrogenase family)